jgi:uncharacterized protein (DUF58 family)
VGEDVEVTVSLTNHGEWTVSDLRLVDGVPSRLGVGDGSPRIGTALEPGESESFTYTVAARRGTHTFDEVVVICRSLAGDVEHHETVSIETPIDCSVTVEDVATGSQTLPYSGPIETDTAGHGVTFFSVREYQSTDSMSRIDWKRFARTNELRTVEYKATRTAAFAVVVDTRIDFAPTSRSPSATQYVKYASERIGSALIADNEQVGAALFDDGAYLSPGSDRTQLLRLRTLVLQGRHPDRMQADHGMIDGFDGQRFFEGALESRSDTVADGGRQDASAGATDGIQPDRDVRRLDRRLLDGAQVLFCTALLDQRAANAAKRFSAYGRDVTVISPDVTTGSSPGNTVERITRADRVRSLRGSVRVVDWEPTQPLAEALARAQQRWSQ